MSCTNIPDRARSTLGRNRLLTRIRLIYIRKIPQIGGWFKADFKGLIDHEDDDDFSSTLDFQLGKMFTPRIGMYGEGFIGDEVFDTNAYDTSPVDSDDRTPDMPIDRQIRYATGVQYQCSEKLSVGGQFVYADYGDAKIKNDLLKGEYDRNDIFFFAVNANWKF